MLMVRWILLLLSKIKNDSDSGINTFHLMSQPGFICTSVILFNAAVTLHNQ